MDSASPRRVKRAVRVGEYVRIGELGRGSFATVYKARSEVTGEVVAIKSVVRSRLSRKLLENLESEVNILKAVRHTHITALIELRPTNAHLHLVMDYCALGDLAHLIRERAYLDRIPGLDVIPRAYPNTPGAGLHEHVTMHFVQHLAAALQYLRARNLVHRDLKPQNLLLTHPSPESSYGSPDLPTLKVADFGFARMLPAHDMASTLCGSPLYMAPEILRYEKYDARADLWSLGAVVYEMLLGKPPFRAENHIDLLRKIDAARDSLVFAPVDSPQLQGLVTGLLRRIPDERISFDELFAHPAVTTRLRPLTHSPPDPDSEYVLVETKAVELNALADEIAASPSPPVQPLLRAATVPLVPAAPQRSGGSILARAITIASTRLQPDPDHDVLLATLAADLARIRAIHRFAEVKYLQLLADTNTLTPGASALLSLEALVLYLKTLSLLQSTMDTVGRHWKHRRTPSPALTSHVQWARDTFNDCLAKADAVKPLADTTAVVTAETLIYDRVLDISRTAALNELAAQDLPASRDGYLTAIAMLEALQASTLCAQDSNAVDNLLVSLRKRLQALRRKLGNL